MATMRAVRIHDTTGLDGVRIEEVERPEPAPGEVLVEVRAAALNHLDLWVSQGQPKPPLPHTLGSDASGVIVELGSGVTGAAVGDEVLLDPSLGCGACERCAAGQHSECARFGILGESRSGTFAGYVACPAHCCHAKPADLGFEEAAAFGLTFLTAYRMLFTRARLQAGEHVLIHGIGGGVATSALILARAAGAEAVVTSSSDKKLARAAELGARGGINYRETPRVGRAACGLIGGRGFDVVVETTGKATWSESLAAARKGGRIVTCGATTGGDPSAGIQTVFWKQLSILGSTMGSREDMRRVVALLRQGAVRPVVDKILPFDSAIDALRRLEGGEQLGKIVLRVGAEAR